MFVIDVIHKIIIVYILHKVMVTDVVHKVMVDAVVKMIMLWVKILKSCQSRSGLLCPYQIPE